MSNALHEPTRVERTSLVSRRAALREVGGGLAVSLLLVAASGPKRSVSAQEAWPVSGAFIGTVTPRAQSHIGEMSVAVIADPPPAPAAPRQVRAYICNGVDRDDWFVGEAAGDDAVLTSESGGQLVVSLGLDEASGSFTLDDGPAQAFAAFPATGLSGLYQVLVTPARAFGASERGIALGYTIADGRLAATFLLPDGSVREVDMAAPRPHPPAIYRTIVLEEGPSIWMHGAERKKGRAKSYVCNGTDA